MALVRRDIRVVYRDGFLITMAAYSLVLAGALRLIVRWIPIDNIAVYAAPFVIIMAPGLIGMVFGFTLIEERETDTWLLLRVLPLSQRALTAYWMGAVSIFCLVITLACAALYGLMPAQPGALFVMAVATSISAPLVMLLFGALASNKIEGLAIGKIISGSSLVLIGLFVLPRAWQVLWFWYPWYWCYLGLERAYAGPELATSLAVSWPGVPAWCFFVVPVILCTAGILILARRYRRAS